MLLTQTDNIKLALTEYQSNGDAYKSDPTDSIDHILLFKISKKLRISYRSLLKGSSFYFPKVKPKLPTAEYVDSMERARLIVAEKEFKLMVQSRNHCEENEWRNVVGQITAITNVIFSIISVFGAVFYLGELKKIDVGMV
jgi:hypothetical protein